MAYIFKGTILGGLCRDCIEPLAGLKIKFYRLASDRNVTALAVAAPKDTFSLLDDAAVEARRRCCSARPRSTSAATSASSSPRATTAGPSRSTSIAARFRA